ncbi:MAG: hypothetical protein A3J46_03205 [Candidatus Yanofskybacteria bacterium RIFCSPHIGHO2_02_FULL_41_11]|uniref:Uncharacterized protein n=1 Tax=Candidatus Yanofskybacteria bacterium RIFCSPHIGHO2_02_FULL_41_11 TaxID=1802675 RepID=A0A1F8F6W0_9BACT|nr:MAG: hypothetical protein A3J46_03205 [Candidatus Yanofskybacteria bacterium RIFCSPHIGHO2_02_FULL_41_11]
MKNFQNNKNLASRRSFLRRALAASKNRLGKSGVSKVFIKLSIDSFMNTLLFTEEGRLPADGDAINFV